MYIKIVDKNFKSKYGQKFEIGKEYCTDGKIVTVPFNFTDSEYIGLIYNDNFPPENPREMKFLELEPLEGSNMDYGFGRLASKRIRIIREIPLDEIIRVDKSGKIIDIIKFLEEC